MPGPLAGDAGNVLCEQLGDPPGRPSARIGRRIRRPVPHLSAGDGPQMPRPDFQR
jgi:hypothetical protein